MGATRGSVHIGAHQTKSWPNSGFEIGATKKGTLFVLVLLCSMDWAQPMFSNPRTLLQPKLSSI